MRRTGGDHREDILLLVHTDIGDHRTVDRDHFGNHAVQIVDGFGAQADRVKTLGELHEIGSASL